jgi:hypothetical protein
MNNDVFGGGMGPEQRRETLRKESQELGMLVVVVRGSEHGVGREPLMTAIAKRLEVKVCLSKSSYAHSAPICFLMVADWNRLYVFWQC